MHNDVNIERTDLLEDHRGFMGGRVTGDTIARRLAWRLLMHIDQGSCLLSSSPEAIERCSMFISITPFCDQN
jgi:hypothetical protein